jgi:hypothetical protein
MSDRPSLVLLPELLWANVFAWPQASALGVNRIPKH